MSTSTEIHLPDIGDFKDVPIIEVHVQPGSRINVDDTLITLESDKATMDIPATATGTVREVRVKTGDRVSQGDLIITLDAEGAPAIPPKERITEEAAPSPGPGQAGYGSPSGVYEAIEVTDPGYRRLQERADHRSPCAAGSDDQGRRPVDHTGVRQGDHGGARGPERHHQGGQGQSGRPRLPGRRDRHYRGWCRGFRCTALRPRARSRPGGLRIVGARGSGRTRRGWAQGACASRKATGRRDRRLPCRGAGARSGARRLHRCLPGRRSGQEGRAGGPLAEPWGRLPERRLHSLQGAPARRQGH